MQALRSLANKDVGAAVRDTLTPTETPLSADELAAQTVRGTVDTAKDLINRGQSRGQAAQRAGWPLAGDYELNDAGQPVNKYGTGDLGHHPGQDVEAHRPYAPAVRGKVGNTIREGRNSPLDGLKKAVGGPLDNVSATDALHGGDSFIEGAGTQAKAPYFAGDLLDNPQSQQFQNNEYAANKPIADAARNASKDTEAERLLKSLRNHEAMGDAEFDRHLTGPEIDLFENDRSIADRLARLDRNRARSHSSRTNSPLNEKY
jgi:hypothetical protein